MKNLKLLLTGLFLSALIGACNHDSIEAPDVVVPDVVVPDVVVPDDPAAGNTISHTVLDTTIVGVSSIDIVLDTARNIKLLIEIISSTGTSRAKPVGCEIFDASEHGYPSSLKIGDKINASGKYGSGVGLLVQTTYHNGKFEGAGFSFLGFRFPHINGGFVYGWLQLNCPQGSPTIQLVDYAFNKMANVQIWAGQKDSDQTFPPVTQHDPVGSASDIIGNYRDHPNPDSGYCNIVISEVVGKPDEFYIQFFPFMWPFPKFNGKIINGKLLIPMTQYSGDIPSPGGTPRPYEGTLSGDGQMFITGPQTRIDWQINYNKTGFLAESFHGLFAMYKCD